MKILSLLVFLTSLACAQAAPAATRDLVFRNVSVLPMNTANILTDQTVIVRNGRIAAIGPDRKTRIPRNARIVDGEGLFLMPGLVDFHTHPGSVEELSSYLLYGQTTIVAMGGEGLQLRKQLNKNIAPHLITSGQTLDNNPPTNRRFHGVKAPSDGPATLDLQLAQKADFVKVYGRMKLPEFQAIIEEARKRNLSVAGHIPQTLTAEAAVSGLDMVAHGEEYLRFLGKPASDSAIDEMAALTARYGTAVTPNLVGYVAMPAHAANLPSILKDEEIRYLPASVYQEWLPQNNRYATRPNIPDFVENSARGLAVLKRLAGQFHKAGILLLAGTDAPALCFPGRCLLDELDLLKASGLSNYETLKTATVNPGIYYTEVMKRPDRFGTITLGARADLLLVRGNPLESLQALKEVEGVVVAGRWLTHTQIATAREKSAPRLARAHEAIDNYERLLASSDFDGIERLFAKMKPSEDNLNSNVLIFDALQLEADKQQPSAIRLLQLASRLLPESFGILNVLARMKGEAGDVAGAQAAYRQSLAIEPLNGVAIDGLAKLNPSANKDPS